MSVWCVCALQLKLKVADCFVALKDTKAALSEVRRWGARGAEGEGEGGQGMGDGGEGSRSLLVWLTSHQIVEMNVAWLGGGSCLERLPHGELCVRPICCL